MAFRGHIGNGTYETLARIAIESDVLSIPQRLRTKGIDQFVVANLPKDDSNELQDFSIQLSR